MPEFILAEHGSNSNEVPVTVSEVPESPFAESTTSVRKSEGLLIDALRSELDSFWTTVRKFQYMDVTEVLLALSAFSARAAEIRSNVMRSESRKLNAFRTREIDPFLDHCDFQFRIHSRLQSIREMEFKMSGGGP